MNITNTRWICGRSCEENYIDSIFQFKKKHPIKQKKTELNREERKQQLLFSTTKKTVEFT